MKTNLHRRDFLTKTALVTAGLSAGLNLISTPTKALPFIEDNIHIIGPREGFSPQIGTLLSMMTWMRAVVFMSVEGMKQSELDFLLDAKSNTIGAMLLHLAATERSYQKITFGWKEEKGDPSIDWEAASELGDAGRKSIKGHNLEYYRKILADTRTNTIEEFKKRDDAWLTIVDPSFFDGQPTNNYCKWFHVCEHESNHNGQIKYVGGRLPAAKAGKD